MAFQSCMAILPPLTDLLVGTESATKIGKVKKKFGVVWT